MSPPLPRCAPGLLVAALGFVLTPAVAAAQQLRPTLEERRAQGYDLAFRFCATCHLTPGAPTAGQPAAPSLRAIANTKGMTAARIAGALTLPAHPMPDMSLTRIELDAIAAYLDSLREDRSTPLIEGDEPHEVKSSPPKSG